MKRRTARENAFKVIFESLFTDLNASDIVNIDKEYDSFNLNKYAEKIVYGVLENRKDIDFKIEPFLKNWKISRIPKVLLAILEVAFYEIMFLKDVEAPIAINEAVEISKKYFDEKGAKFVNGVLGSFIRNNIV